MKDFGMKVKGVNLGNWLVLEKWLNPALFEGPPAEDQYYHPRQHSREAYEARIRTHRNEYITERDFVTIRSWGMDAVRIPVPYFIFGDREPFIGCVEELDKAFDWAEKWGLKILIDLHTAPMGQNGFDNGGICGVVKWAQTPDEVAFELSVLKRLAQRYGHRPGLWGIEVLNEPMTENLWYLMKVQERYPPVDKEMAEGSAPISFAFLRQFYLDAFDVIRPHIADDKYIVIHDGFELDAWEGFMAEEKYDCVVLDTHIYLMMSDMNGGRPTVESYENFLATVSKPTIARMQKHFPVVCGEWCLSNGVVAGWENSLSADEKMVIYRALCKAQLDAWSAGSGYFYWSYKLLQDSTRNPGGEGWDLGRCVDIGWFDPKNK